jgi:hypothetical protein
MYQVEQGLVCSNDAVKKSNLHLPYALYRLSFISAFCIFARCKADFGFSLRLLNTVTQEVKHCHIDQMRGRKIVLYLPGKYVLMHP